MHEGRRHHHHVNEHHHHVDEHHNHHDNPEQVIFEQKQTIVYDTIAEPMISQPTFINSSIPEAGMSRGEFRASEMIEEAFVTPQ